MPGNATQQHAIHYRYILHFFWGLGSTTPQEKQKSANNSMTPPAKSMLEDFCVFIFFEETL
jgi:hypothetical protein